MNSFPPGFIAAFSRSIGETGAGGGDSHWTFDWLLMHAHSDWNVATIRFKLKVGLRRHVEIRNQQINLDFWVCFFFYVFKTKSPRQIPMHNHRNSPSLPVRKRKRSAASGFRSSSAASTSSDGSVKWIEPHVAINFVSHDRVSRWMFQPSGSFDWRRFYANQNLLMG